MKSLIVLSVVLVTLLSALTYTFAQQQNQDWPCVLPGQERGEFVYMTRAECVKANGRVVALYPGRPRKAVINDPDGYTNIRRGPGMQYAIRAQIMDGQVFMAFESPNKDWWIVRTPDGTWGFMHASRIRLLE